MNNSHKRAVRYLYKSILRLHRGLPEELKLLGSSYIKEEFRRHKKCDPAVASVFLKCWAEYASILTKQLRSSVHLRSPSKSKRIGAHIDESVINSLRDEQIAQLYELLKATKSEK